MPAWLCGILRGSRQWNARGAREGALGENPDEGTQGKLQRKRSSNRFGYAGSALNGDRYLTAIHRGHAGLRRAPRERRHRERREREGRATDIRHCHTALRFKRSENRPNDSSHRQSSASGRFDVSLLASIAISAIPAAPTRYHAGASLFPVAPISHVATNGAVPPNSAFAVLKQNAKPV